MNPLGMLKNPLEHQMIQMTHYVVIHVLLGSWNPCMWLLLPLWCWWPCMVFDMLWKPWTWPWYYEESHEAPWHVKEALGTSNGPNDPLCGDLWLLMAWWSPGTIGEGPRARERPGTQLDTWTHSVTCEWWSRMGLIMIWHLDDGVLGHTCHGDGVLDEALIGLVLMMWWAHLLAWHTCLDLHIKCIPLTKVPCFVVNLIQYGQQNHNVDYL